MIDLPASPKIRYLPDKIYNETDLNPSLFYQKLAEWNPDWDEHDEKLRRAKKEHVKRLNRMSPWYPNPVILSKYIHQGALESFPMITDARLLIGRGTPSVFEQGISIHHLYGVPIISGSAIVSIVLNLPTTGPVLLRALMYQDMYLAGSFVMILSTLTIIGTLVSDILLAMMDPRIRYGGISR